MLACSGKRGENMRYALLCAVLLAALTAAEVEEAGGLTTDLRRIELENVSGSITVVPSSGNGLSVDWVITAAGQPGLDAVSVESGERDGRLMVSTSCEESEDMADVAFTVGVPPDWDGSLRLEQVSGDITCTGGGEFDLYAECVSGRVEARDITGTAELSAVSGEVVFSGLPGLESAGVVSGSLEGALVPLASDLEVESVSGDITLSLPEELPGRVEVSTLSGNLDIGPGLEGFTVEEEPMGTEAWMGDSTPVLDISTVSGGIIIRSL